MRTGITTMTLDYCQCPAWLFQRMTRLGRVVAIAIISELGSSEFLRRLADPVWFQSLGTLMAFDWNASGLTVTTLAALKEALRGLEKDADVYICGGKGKTSKKTPNQILNWSDTLGFDQKTSDRLVYTSRATAKVDSALIQDGFNLYHHNFFFNKKGHWTVVQQGMNTTVGRARRYHWLGPPAGETGEKVKNLIEEPHSGIASQAKLPTVLDLTSKKSQNNRETSLALVRDEKSLYRSLKILAKVGVKAGVRPLNYSRSDPNLDPNLGQLKILDLPGIEFSHHPVENEFLHPQLRKAINKVVVAQPNSFESLLMTPGVGGKDGTPYPIDRATYDKTLAVLENPVRKSNLYFHEKKTLVNIYRLHHNLNKPV